MNKLEMFVPGIVLVAFGFLAGVVLSVGVMAGRGAGHQPITEKSVENVGSVDVADLHAELARIGDEIAGWRLEEIARWDYTVRNRR